MSMIKVYFIGIGATTLCSGIVMVVNQAAQMHLTHTGKVFYSSILSAGLIIMLVALKWKNKN